MTPDFFRSIGGVLEVNPDICRRRHGGNPLSQLANPTESAKQRDRQKILGLLMRQSMTCDEVELDTGLSHQTASARFSELKRDGKIKQVGTRKTRTGASAGVFIAA